MIGTCICEIGKCSFSYVLAFNKLKRDHEDLAIINYI